MLNITEDGLRRWRRDGKGPVAYRLSYRTLRYRPQDVEAWMLQAKDRPKENESDNHP